MPIILQPHTAVSAPCCHAKVDAAGDVRRWYGATVAQRERSMMRLSTALGAPGTVRIWTEEA